MRQLRQSAARWLAKRRGIGGWLTTVTAAGRILENLDCVGMTTVRRRTVVSLPAALACVGATRQDAGADILSWPAALACVGVTLKNNG